MTGSSWTRGARPERIVVGAAVALYAAMILLSVTYAEQRRRALDFHERDFPFYAQFDVRAFDGRYSAHYSLNPNGHDLFGFFGTEGMHSFHQAIHFEPLKYLMAASYRPTGLLLVPFALMAIAFFAPIPFFALRLPRRDRLDLAFALLACLAYALYPSALPAATFDLRPFSLLMPMFVMAALSLLLARPRRETLLLFNALFLIREEALIFGLVLLFVALAEDLRISGTPGASTGTRPPLLPMIVSYATWTAAEVAYFAWCGYGNRLPLAVPLAIAGSGLTGAGVIVGVARWMGRRPDRASKLAWLPWLAMLPLFAPLAAQQVVDRDLVTHPNLALYAPMYALHAGSALAALVGGWLVLRSSRARRAMLIGMGALVLGLGVAHAVRWKRTPLEQLSSCQTRAIDAAIVLQVRDETDPLQSAILTDQLTFQAFYDYEHVLVYERLPWHLVAGEARRWPRNERRLRRELRREIEWIVIARASHDDIQLLIEHAHLGPSVERVAANDRYEVYRVTRR